MELKFDPKNPKYQYITAVDEAQKACEQLAKERVLSVDVEANSLDPHTGTLLLVQISSETESYIFDARKIPLKEIALYKQLLENANIIKLFHNASFDYKYLKVHTD